MDEMATPAVQWWCPLGPIATQAEGPGIPQDCQNIVSNRYLYYDLCTTIICTSTMLGMHSAMILVTGAPLAKVTASVSKTKP